MIRRGWIKRKIWDLGKEPIEVRTKRYFCQVCGHSFIRVSITNNAAVSRTKTRYKLIMGFGSVRGAYSALLIAQAITEVFEHARLDMKTLFS